MKLLLEECYKDEFDDLQDNEYSFGHEDGQNTVLSPYRVLINHYNKYQYEYSDLFYNNLDIPEFWYVYPQGLDGKIMYHDDKKANIYFKEPIIKRNVHKVEWLNNGFNYKTDYYDLYGLKFFSEYYDQNLGLLMTSFYTDDNKEVLTIHHQNEAFLVNTNDKTNVFYSYREFVQYVESFMKG